MKKYTRKDIGVYGDSARGAYLGEFVQKVAKGHGWKGDFENRNSEFYNDAWDEANEFMNKQFAVDGAYWGESDNGDWGLFEIHDNPLDDPYRLIYFKNGEWKRGSTLYEHSHEAMASIANMMKKYPDIEVGGWFIDKTKIMVSAYPHKHPALKLLAAKHWKFRF